MSSPGVSRSLTPTVVTVDAGPATRTRFHTLVVRAHREGTGPGPVLLPCSADRPGVVAPQE